MYGNIHVMWLPSSLINTYGQRCVINWQIFHCWTFRGLKYVWSPDQWSLRAESHFVTSVSSMDWEKAIILPDLNTGRSSFGVILPQHLLTLNKTAKCIQIKPIRVTKKEIHCNTKHWNNLQELHRPLKSLQLESKQERNNLIKWSFFPSIQDMENKDKNA